MIISASRRTDIPAFYSEWFMNRIRAGYCAVPNPFNPNQISRVSLKPDEVDVIVFWTRNPAPLMPHLGELDAAGYRYYFQYTLLDNPRELDPRSPPVQTAIERFKALSDQIGPRKVIWRYDPIVLSTATGAHYHMERYDHIAGQLQGYTFRSVISIVDFYKKASRRVSGLEKQGIKISFYRGEASERFDLLLNHLVRSAAAHGFGLFSCAEPLDLVRYGVKPGRCVDGEYIHEVFGISVTDKKDPSQRAACGCAASKDIGMYDSCLFGCSYCYATTSFDRARSNHGRHDPRSASLIG